MFTEKDGDDSDAESELDENELDKQMGDLDGKDADKLDEQVWGSDDEQEEEKKVIFNWINICDSQSCLCSESMTWKSILDVSVSGLLEENTI